MTYQALTTAITGLRAAQQQLSTISNNVTNATTPGYNRQIVPQKTQVLRDSGQTVGVLTQNVIRVVDMNLQRDLWTQVSASSMQNVQIQYMQQIQNFNGPPDKEFSIAAKLADLRDSFSALSDIPDDLQALEATLNQAHIVADKFNDYADLLTTLRNDTQGDLETSVTTVNGLLQEITSINTQIRNAEGFGNSVAGLQDQRDIAIKALTEEMDITFFERSDGVLVVQTRDGLELAGDVAHTLEFDAVPLGALEYYPQSASALNLLNITNNRTTTIDITERGVGGKLGGLLELRDTVLPRYTAQLDELAYQTASRFQAQGLELFTDQNGLVPLNTAPDPNALPTPISVPYVDFARNMQVNVNIDNDLTLLQQGTATQDVTVPTGDNSVIRRVIEFAFGDVNYQEAAGSIDLDDIGGGAADLQEWLGLQSVNRVVTGVDLGSFAQIDDGIPGTNTDLIEVLQDQFLTFPDDDAFQIRFEEARTGLGPTDITIDLSRASQNFPIGGGINDALDQIIAEINLQIAEAGVDPQLAANATRNNYGQLVIESSGTVEINGPYAPVAPFDRVVPPPPVYVGNSDLMSADAIDALGIQTGSFAPEDPSFTIQVGNDEPVTITIEPGDTITELLDKLEWDNGTQTGVPGLFVDFDAGTGFLTIRPGIDDSNFGPLDTVPVFGGDIKITSGPFTINGATEPTLALNDGINIVSALFGSFGAGPVDNSPITNVGYVSEISNASGTFINIRNEFLGPGADISTGIFSSTSLIDYAQKIVNATSQDYLQAQTTFENEDTLRSIIQREFSDESGVNIDEEMSNLIIVQTAYAAAARAVTAADEMFQELINSIRR